jgi:hypothetical protein
MKSYHFDMGNTNEGCVGPCAQVVASSAEEAVQLLKDAFDNAKVAASVERDGPGTGLVALSLRPKAVDYLHVYLNFDNLSPRDIYDVEECE